MLAYCQTILCTYFKKSNKTFFLSITRECFCDKSVIKRNNSEFVFFLEVTNELVILTSDFKKYLLGNNR